MSITRNVAAAAVLTAAMPAIADEAQSPREFLDAWAAAWRTSDADKMMSFYDAADETLAIESLGRARKGPAAIRTMYESAFDELFFDRVTLTPIAERHHGDVAWATCRYVAEMRLRSDNSKHLLEVRGSFVMKKDGDTWKITLEHFSTIPDVPRVRAVE